VIQVGLAAGGLSAGSPSVRLALPCPSSIGAYLGVVFVRLGLAFTLWYAGQALGAYLAVEPFVRRRMPELLTSWTRLVSGGWRDPLAGRDVLIGVLAGVAFIAVLSAGTSLLI
jgi:hypothetical protein